MTKRLDPAIKYQRAEIMESYMAKINRTDWPAVMVKPMLIRFPPTGARG